MKTGPFYGVQRTVFYILSQTLIMQTISFIRQIMNVRILGMNFLPPLLGTGMGEQMFPV